jgi:glucose-1-phosphate adenylyltransferase
MTTALLTSLAARSHTINSAIDMRRVATVILGGGQGTRLFPLTVTRCKPAISFGGKYRLIDVALSNAINSSCDQIFIITQFLSSSLHKHICNTYQGSNVFSRGFIDLLPAEQKPSAHHWFQGTADAVRQNLYYLTEAAADYFLILSGDQLYDMDFRAMVAFAQRKDADLVIAALPVNENDAQRMGIMQLDDTGSVVNFVEKPQESAILNALRCDLKAKKQIGLKENDSRHHLGSMGIYLFKRNVLIDLLQQDTREDFGKHLLPAQIEKGNTYAFLHDGYWEDIGTIKSFYEANISLTFPNPLFNFHSEERPIIKSPSKLPGAKIHRAQIDHAIICEGSVIDTAEITHSIIGPRSIIHQNCQIHRSYIMGNDFYHPPSRTERFPEQLQISEGCVLKNVIVDKDVYLGKNVKLINQDNLTNYDSERVYIRDKIIIVPRGASLPDGFTL